MLVSPLFGHFFLIFRVIHEILAEPIIALNGAITYISLVCDDSRSIDRGHGMGFALSFGGLGFSVDGG